MNDRNLAGLTKEILDKERLARLRDGDGHRTWRSLEDRRFCVRCTRVFNGHEVEIANQNGSDEVLRCPTEGCDSTPLHWLFCGREPGPPAALERTAGRPKSGLASASPAS